jgi:RimJ/RimL family protein N-acetyltransferase
MLHILDPQNYHRALPLFGKFDLHLAGISVLRGDAPGTVWVDSDIQPSSVLVSAGHRFILGGDDHNAEFNAGLKRLFTEEIYPHAQAVGQVDFAMYYPAPAWEETIPFILEGRYPNQDQRCYLQRGPSPLPAWREHLPAGFEAERIDAALLDRNLENSEDVRRETVSECPSLDFFLQQRFGFCLHDDHQIVSWCMAEYNTGARCEIGIETVEAYQRRGLGALTANTLLEYAYTHGIARVGWHCWAANQPSMRTALHLGFEKVCDYPVYYAWFDECANLAVQANRAFNRGQPVEALAWFECAQQKGQPPLWSYVIAAFIQNQLGDKTQALACIHQALEGGFQGLDWIRNAEPLQDLHDRPEWKAMLG